MSTTRSTTQSLKRAGPSNVSVDLSNPKRRNQKSFAPPTISVIYKLFHNLFTTTRRKDSHLPTALLSRCGNMTKNQALTGGQVTIANFVLW